jgi:hypothetical protein
MSMSLFLFSWRYLDPIGFLFWPQFLYWPQFIGFWAAIMIWGNEVTKAGIAEISIPINAAVYSLAIFCLTRVVANRRSSTRATA